MDKTDSRPDRGSGGNTAANRGYSSGNTMNNVPVRESFSVQESMEVDHASILLRSGSQNDAQQFPGSRGSSGSMSGGDSGFASGSGNSFCQHCGSSSSSSSSSSVSQVQGVTQSMQASSIVERFVDPGSCYNMDHAKRGVCLIINNTEFRKETKMPDRKGSDIDASSLYRVFKSLGFDVYLKNNQTTVEMLKLVEGVSKQDHSNSDCFVMAILTHGEEGTVYGVNGFIKLDSLIAPVKGNGCKSLIGKPKLFFIQACRGTQFDEGVHCSDAVPDETSQREEKIYKIPMAADFLFAYSSPPGYYSFRHNTKGSWFIQALAKVFEEDGTKKELMQLLTRVNRIVAVDYESRAKNPEHSGKKQIPSIVSMLTKELYFKQK